MTNFRTLDTTLRCLRCGAQHDEQVQFEAGAEAAPGHYEGVAEAFCPECESLWVEFEKRTHFEQLAREVELGTVLALQPRPLTSDEIRALARFPEHGDAPSFGARLSAAGITVRSNSDALHEAWWRPHYEAVDEQLREQGWSTGADPYRSLKVTIAADGQLRVESSEP